MKDYSKVDKYGLITKEWYGETYEQIDKDSFGKYVLYSDYLKLLNDTVPPRLPASFDDVYNVIEQKVLAIENEATSIFERKDTGNYRYAANRFKIAQELRDVLKILKEEVSVS